MARFTSYDGTELAYRVTGTGRPLLCLPGGAGRAGSYLGDLGGLSEHRQLVVLDNRGTGDSDAPADPATYRRDRLAHDVEALRGHLGLGRVDVLGHAAGAGIAMAYAVDHTDRLRSLVLLSPALRAVDLTPTTEDRARYLASRSGEPWFADATAALELLHTGADEPSARVRAAPLFYGRWDAAARAHAEAEAGERSPEALRGYWAEGAFAPGHTRRALMELDVPLLVHVGDADPIAPTYRCAELVDLIPGATLSVQPGGGHFPWLDDPDHLVKRLADFPH
ncbi:alpha/beta fold hydrolase [Umezawaea tangerina]|uniref:Pimeloyl-ACP methyl ester carboxylesterase n=1 Tax=Umezawaea tangerina TaxID=84725 RepID=A0A2T0SMU1_9PSEU|nr:alpha/beta hydrolase [Umezawaea tangerina]PRY34732.1 pimeloyl-ACP methyl ester carboxylesterase [Umezawaea tangerina]